MDNRKLSVIMFTDMVGYSRKVQENEDLALDLLKTHNAILDGIIRKNGGRTVKTIGDAFLADFDSVIKALTSAVEIQRQLIERNKSESPERQIEVRIGIHVGDVVYRDNDVFGDGVNIASRIEAMAEGGEVFVSQDVYSIAHGKSDFSFDDLGAHYLKNIARPVRIFGVAYDPEKKARKLHAGKASVRGRRNAIAAIVAALVAVVLIIVLMPASQTAKGAKPSLAIVAFSNKTYDDRLNQIEIGRIINDAMIQKFYEYPVVQLVSPLRIERIIRESGIDRGDLADNPDLAEQIARETGARLMISGSIKKLGGTFVLTADLHDLEAQSLLSSYQRNENSEAAILGPLIDSACHRFQEKISFHFGMEDTLQRSGIGIGDLTTHSLEAYRHFVIGNEYHNLGEFDKAIDEFQRALAIDSNFSLAYSLMGCSLSWAKRDSEITDAYIAKLKSVAPRFQGTSKEALIFRGNLAWFENREEDILNNYKLTIDLYPDDRDAYYYYAIALAQLKHDHEKAILNFEKARSFAPEYFPVYRDLAYSLKAVGKTDVAINMLKEYIKNYPAKREVEYARKQIAELRGVHI